MALTLRVENQTSLPDGGALSISIHGKRGIDIGRDQYLDWTLPDPDRVISGKHCEIRWRDNAYWLHDTSTNGTYLLGAETRLPVPYRIRNGDRFLIGHYVIAASIDGQTADAVPVTASTSPASYDEIWSTVGDVAPPMNPKQLKPNRESGPMKADFLEWAVDVPWTTPVSRRAPSTPAPPSEPVDDMDWAHGVRIEPAPVAVASPMPEPRRPVWTDDDAPWSAAPQPQQSWPEIIETRPAAQPPIPLGDKAPPIAHAVPPATRSWPESEIEPAAPQILADEAERGSSANDGVSGLDQFVRSFSRGAGLPEDALAGCDPALLAEQVGQLLRVLTESAKKLLETRQRAKRLARSSDHTTIQALNNNPLKFAPTADEAMRLMFAPPGGSYLDARAAFRQSFDDLKSHEVQTYSAMQYALKALLAEFDPGMVEQRLSGERGLADVFGSRKAGLWDAYVAHWKVRTQSKKDALLNAFMAYFAEHYDDDFGRADERAALLSGRRAGLPEGGR
jgi:type VI secretion system protein ImpI